MEKREPSYTVGGYLFYVKFPFKIFPPSYFSVGFSVSSFRGSLYILYIPDICPLLAICVFMYVFAFLFIFLFVLLCLCWILAVAHRLFIAEHGPLSVVACDLQSAWAQ